MNEIILVVDDDPVQRGIFESMIQRFGYGSLAVAGGDAALKVLAEPDGARCEAIILDLVMPDLDGLGVLAKLGECGSSIPVIVSAGHGGIENVISAMRAGATDFVGKPVEAERLQVSLRNALAMAALRRELTRLKCRQLGAVSFTDIVTRSPKLQGVLHTARKAAVGAAPILLEGESGVGKQLIARAIHGSGERRTKPFVVVDCASVPVDATLFGHDKRGFSGVAPQLGKLLEASAGTLFLDRIGQLPVAAQVKLLQVIHAGEVESGGGRRPVKVNVRLVASADHPLFTAVTEGRFRQDLYDRLSVLSIAVPPLRERPEDIPELVRHFLTRFSAEEAKPVGMVSADAMSLLRTYRWPGNVRQLEHAMFRAVLLADGDQLGLNAFPQIAALSGLGATGESAGDVAPVASPDAAPAMVTPTPLPVAQGLEVPAAGPPGAALELLDDAGEIRSLDAIEADLIRFAVGHYRGQMSEVARRLQIGRSTLYRRLKELGIPPDDTRELPVHGVALE